MPNEKTVEQAQEENARIAKLAELSRLRESKQWKEFVAKLANLAEMNKARILTAVSGGTEKEKSASEHDKDHAMIVLFQDVISMLPDHPGSKFLAEDIQIQIDNIESGILNGIGMNVGALISTRSAKFYSDIDLIRMARGVYATIDSRLEKAIDALKTDKKSEEDENDPYEK